MIEQIRELFERVSMTPAALPLAFVLGLAGQLVRTQLDRYWKIFAGFAAVLVGLAALRLLPFKIPKVRLFEGVGQKTGPWEVTMFGLLLGGGISVCTLCCNPGLFLVLGVALIQGRVYW